ncbi:MAG: permease [Tissierellia bacterium]|nr:permease [Tissierellia bacterium]
MDIFTLILWIGTLIFLGLSFIKDKEKTKQALRMAFHMGKGMALSIFTIIFAIGLILTLIPPEKIGMYIGKQPMIVSIIAFALLGTVTLIPAFIAFPLVGTLVQAGVGIMPSVSFLTTLTMVGAVTFPLEKKEFGLKFTLLRNGLSFLFAIIIAIVMGVFIK